jgi:hypothetical protein
MVLLDLKANLPETSPNGCAELSSFLQVLIILGIYNFGVPTYGCGPICFKVDSLSWVTANSVLVKYTRPFTTLFPMHTQPEAKTWHIIGKQTGLNSG